MDKKVLLIGNIKMNMDAKTFVPYFKELKKITKNANNIAGVCVPSVYLPLAQKCLHKSNVLYGAQNMHFEDKGAFTGELSADMLKDYGTRLVTIGHSERRSYYNETDASVNKKVLKALSKEVTPIICVGETLDERNAKKHKTVVKKQVEAALKNVPADKLEQLWFAYEPVWAIGTGVSATSKDAEDMCASIKQTVAKLYNLERNGEDVIVLYGGSMNEKNCSELLNQKSIDGGLIGGACLKLDAFKQIIETKLN